MAANSRARWNLARWPIACALRSPTSPTLADSWRCAASELPKWCASRRDLAGWAALPETLFDTSAFADAAIQAAVDFAAQDLARTYGEPRAWRASRNQLHRARHGQARRRRAQLTSDIDLIFLFPDKGRASGARYIDNEEDFSRLGAS